MKYYKNEGVGYVRSNKLEEIALNVALKEIDKLTDKEVVIGSFIGFTNEKKARRFSQIGLL